MRRVLTRRAVILVWLTAVWVTLWEALSWANFLGGVVVGLATLHLMPPRESISEVGIRPWAALKLLSYFLWQLVEASVIVAWEVITPRNRINAAVVSVRLRSQVAGIITSVASMVSLTPGTVTLEVDEENSTLFIHVLHLKSVEQTQESVRLLEELTIAAFPTRGGNRVAPSEGNPK